MSKSTASKPASNAALLWIDPAGCIIDASEQICQALGYAREELLTLAVWDIDPGFPRERWPAHWQKLCQAKSLRFEATCCRKDGRLIPVEVLTHHVEFAGHEHICALVRMITPQRRAETTLRESEERLTLALEASGQGLYDLDLTTGKAVFSDEYARMLGYEPSELDLTLAAWVRWLHPEDHKRVLGLYQDYITGKRSDYQAEFRLRARSGDWIWVRSVGKVVQWDAAGRPLRMVGTHLDITQHKQAEAALQASEAFLDSVIAQSPLPIVICDAAGTVIRFNQASRELFQVSEQAVGRYNLFQDEQLREQGYLPLFERVFRCGETVRIQSRYNAMQLQPAPSAHPAHWLDLDSTTFPVKDANGNIAHAVVFHLDITDRKAAEAQLRYHLDLEQAVAEISALMIKPGWEDFDARMNWTLERIGGLTHTDRSYLFMIAPDGRTLRNTHEWCASGAHPQIQDLQNLPIADYQPFYDQLQRDEVVTIQTSSVPDETPLKAALLEGGVRSLLCIAVNWGGKLQGFIGFDTVATERTWREEDVRLLCMVAEIVAHTLQHIESDRILRDNAHFLENLDRISRILTRREQTADLLADLAVALREIFQADRVFFLHPCDPDAATFQITMEATQPEYPGASATSADVIVDEAFRSILRQALRRAGPVLTSFAATSSDVARRYHIQSQMAIALHPQSDQPWLLGLHQCAGVRRWTETEQRLFQTIAERISDALAGHLLLKRLQESEERYRVVFENAHDAIIVHDFQGAIQAVNQTMLTLYGLEYEEALAATIFDLSKPDNTSAPPEPLWARVAQGETLHFEWQAKRPKDGCCFPVEVLLRAIQLGGRNCILATIRDITERKRAEEALLMTQFSMDHASDSIVWVDDQGNLIYVNDAACTSMGYAREELLSMKVFDIDPDFPAEGFEEHMIELRRRGAMKFESRHRRKDGRLFPVEVTTNYLEYNGRFHGCAFDRDITDRKRAEAELQQHRNHLEELVAERTAELRQAMAQLVQAEKLAALGSLVAGVAHELSTPLGNTRVVASSLGDDLRAFVAAVESGSLRRSQVEAFLSRGCEAVDLLERNTARAADLINDFKQVAVDQTSMRRRCFNLHQTLEEMLATLRPLFKHTTHRLELDIPPDLELDSYPGPLEQVIANLINNSLIHGFAGIEAGFIRIRAAPQGPDQVQMDYQDNGVGIPEMILNRIFEPFFTTRLGQGGSGLGLYIVYTLVAGVLGGRIEARSEPGQGAEFSIRLPLTAPRVSPPDETPRNPSDPNTGLN